MEPSPCGRRRAARPAARSAVRLAVATALLGWVTLLPAAAETVEFTIGDDRITESSGLATDRDNQRYWTVNDSGDAGIAYALDDQGDLEGTVQFRVDPVDVEAVAFHDGDLYVADIGDNRSRRDFVTVYVLGNAEPAEQPVVYNAYDLAYPDGPHDAETLLVDRDGRLFLVTKDTDGGAIYAAPTSPSRQGVNELERVADAPASVTDGTVLPDGRFALRTYTSVEVLDPESYRVTARSGTPAQRQGESITTTFDGDALLIGSEGKQSKVLRIDVPSGLGEAPSPSASPSSASPSSPSASPAPPTDDPGTGNPSAEEPVPTDDESPEVEAPATSRQGTLAALGIAAAIALVAGAVVVLVRRA